MVRRLSARSHRAERGAAAVEFAIILPVFIMLAIGMFTGGITYNQKDHITHAAREGSRYAATVPKDQYGTAPLWAQNIKDVAIARTDGIVDESETGHEVCVALVSGSPGAAVSGTGGTFAYNLPSGQNRCFDDGGADGGERVQVSIERPGQISAVFFEMNPTLRSQAVSRYEEIEPTS